MVPPAPWVPRAMWGSGRPAYDICVLPNPEFGAHGSEGRGFCMCARRRAEKAAQGGFWRPEAARRRKRRPPMMPPSLDSRARALILRLRSSPGQLT